MRLKSSSMTRYFFIFSFRLFFITKNDPGMNEVLREILHMITNSTRMALRDGFYGNGEVKNKEEIKTISAASLSFREMLGG